MEGKTPTPMNHRSLRDDSEILTKHTQEKFTLRRLHVDQWLNMSKLATSFLFVCLFLASCLFSYGR